MLGIGELNHLNIILILPLMCGPRFPAQRVDYLTF